MSVLARMGSALVWWLGVGFAATLMAAPRQALIESSAAATRGLVPVRPMPATQRLSLTLGLPLRHRVELEQFLGRLYDPASPDYRHFLTTEEFTRQFGPTAGDYDALKAWVRAGGLSVVGEHRNRLLLDVEGGTAEIERVFHVSLGRYPHPREPREFFAPDRPPSVEPGVPLLEVSGLNDYQMPRSAGLRHAPGGQPRGAIPWGGSGPGGAYLGKDFRAAYAPGVALTGAGQTLALLEFDGYFASDIQAYFTKAGMTPVPLQNVLIDGFSGVPAPGNNNSVEVSLDIELAAAMAPGLAAIVVYEAPTNGLKSYDVLNRMATDNTAKQVSSSWEFLTTTAGSIDQIFMEFAAQGQTFFSASGDNGADLVGTAPAPSDDPYITVVGGTTLTTGATGGWSSEVVWNWYTSGSGTSASQGGVSTTYNIPPWQAGISMTANQGSTTKRNYPDVAMLADGVWVSYNQGQSGSWGGTSCASPLWAAFTALVNQQAMASSGATVGFLNPSLYAIGRGSAYAACFHDIQRGNSFTSSSSTKFVATAGYDLCTGWGTPTGQSLINALASRANALVVAPTNGFTAIGAASGPFLPATGILTLTNTGITNLSWAVANTNAWLSVSPAAGVLTPASPQAALTVSLTAQAAQVTAGAYQGTIVVSNLSAGISALTVPYTLLAGQNAMVNGGFETGDFTGWTVIGSSLDNHVTSAGAIPAHPELVHSGLYAALVGEVGQLGYLYQTVPTVPGQAYWLSCWVASPYLGQPDSPNEFQISWGAATNSLAVLFDQVDMAPFNWTNLVFAVVAAGTNSVVEFGARNDPEQFGLDDVSLVPVATPRIARVSAAAGALGLSWDAAPGMRYQLQSSTNLVGGAWAPVGPITVATNTTVSASGLPAGGPAAFYRVVLVR